MNSMGTKAITNAMGACAPTASTTQPSVATREYTGAVEASPITVEPNSPSVPVASPLPSPRERSMGVVVTAPTLRPASRERQEAPAMAIGS